MRAANSIQRIKKDPSIGDPQPPPYQDKGPVACVSRPRAEREVRRGSLPQHCTSSRCSSEASVDQDTESYLNKGCEEDIPSDSTAVLGPEVRAHRALLIIVYLLCMKKKNSVVTLRTRQYNCNSIIVHSLYD